MSISKTVIGGKLILCLVLPFFSCSYHLALRFPATIQSLYVFLFMIEKLTKQTNKAKKQQKQLRFRSNTPISFTFKMHEVFGRFIQVSSMEDKTLIASPRQIWCSCTCHLPVREIGTLLSFNPPGWDKQRFKFYFCDNNWKFEQFDPLRIHIFSTAKNQFRMYLPKTFCYAMKYVIPLVLL